MARTLAKSAAINVMRPVLKIPLCSHRWRQLADGIHPKTKGRGDGCHDERCLPFDGVEGMVMCGAYV